MHKKIGNLIERIDNLCFYVIRLKMFSLSLFIIHTENQGVNSGGTECQVTLIAIGAFLSVSDEYDVIFWSFADNYLFVFCCLLLSTKLQNLAIRLLNTAMFAKQVFRFGVFCLPSHDTGMPTPKQAVFCASLNFTS